MKRAKRHKIKLEKPETSSAFNTIKEEHDLAYYIHDRVELMHQVFSVLKTKDLLAMAPECVRKLSIDDLQELCTEELLGISSKRLLAILDGAEPPSDTESSQSSQEPMETISLDSISSDEELLSQSSKKKKHKHKRRDSKAKKNKKKSTSTTDEAILVEDPERSKASRAGLTVLELLELQARARAIRAQLQQEHAHKQATEPTAPESSQQTSTDSEVEIKEETAEVVEISSDDEKPSQQQLMKALSSMEKENGKEPEKNDKEADVASKNTAKNTTEINKSKDSTKSKKKKEKSKKKDKRKDSEKDANKPEESSRKDSLNSISEVNQLETAEDDKTTTEDNSKVTKRVNDLIITVPQTSTRKIKLNRNKMTVSVPNNTDNDITVIDTTKTVTVTSVVTKPVEKVTETNRKISSAVSKPKAAEDVAKTTEPAVKSVVKTADSVKVVTETNKDKSKVKDKTKKRKKKEKEKQSKERQSIDEDHDEITLQLSDSEKMDLLQDFDRKDYDKVSSSSSDSESSSSSSDSENSADDSTVLTVENSTKDTAEQNTQLDELKTAGEDPKGDENDQENVSIVEENVPETNKESQDDPSVENSTVVVQDVTQIIDENTETDNTKDSVQTKSPEKESTECTIAITGYISTENINENESVIEITNIDDIPIQNDSENLEFNPPSPKIGSYLKSDKITEVIEKTDIEICINNEGSDAVVQNIENSDKEVIRESLTEVSKDSNSKDSAKALSDGELSSNESSEVEAVDLKPEVVCISDEETPKKKKKKDKKSKKEKKKKSDFQETGDQNFYKDDQNIVINDNIIILEDENDVFEVLELSDDSSCYEVEGTTLSKEPTVEEIAALSAKIDEIEKKEIVSGITTEDRIDPVIEEKTEQERLVVESNKTDNLKENLQEPENISWKDRYLGSKRVKKVLTTSNLLNALRKKNKELKKKMEESKKIEQENLIEEVQEPEKPIDNNLEEGSIEHYNALEGSTKYVNPVPDPKDLEKIDEEKVGQKEIEIQVTGEMKKDAKQLLKMYKKLLKYNDMTKQKDPNKKKQKKKKKKEKKAASTSTVVNEV